MPSATHERRSRLPQKPCGRTSDAFTLVELLVVIAVISLLLAILLPSFAGARAQARRVKCGSNIRQLGISFGMYADDHASRVMPLAYTTPETMGGGPPIYWWGTSSSAGVDYTRGFTWRYLQSEPRPDSVYECPSQAWGSYTPQGTARAPTSTYGYNGYYLCPPHTPGWSFLIGSRPWLFLERVRNPSRVFAFGDTMLANGSALSNNALLDPPKIYMGNQQWDLNPSPTSSFRHEGRMNAVFVDGHVESLTIRDGIMTSNEHRIGSLTRENDPFYVPDFREW